MQPKLLYFPVTVWGGGLQVILFIGYADQKPRTPENVHHENVAWFTNPISLLNPSNLSAWWTFKLPQRSVNGYHLLHNSTEGNWRLHSSPYAKEIDTWYAVFVLIIWQKYVGKALTSIWNYEYLLNYTSISSSAISIYGLNGSKSQRGN